MPPTVLHSRLPPQTHDERCIIVGFANGKIGLYSCDLSWSEVVA